MHPSLGCSHGTQSGPRSGLERHAGGPGRPACSRSACTQARGAGTGGVPLWWNSWRASRTRSQWVSRQSDARSRVGRDPL